MKRTRVSLALILATTGLSLPAHAEITCGANGYRMETCQLAGQQFGKNRQWTVEVRSTGYSVGGTTGEGQCLVTTIKKGNAQSGDNVVYTVEKKDGSLFKGSETIPKCANSGGGNSGGGNTGGNNGGGNTGGGTVNPPPQPQNKPRQQVLNVATENARCFANLVVETYAAAENARYNVRSGMLNALQARRFSDLLNGSDVRNTNSYFNGVAQGRANGQHEGRSEGLVSGQNAGAAQGSADASARFAAIVDTQAQLDSSLQVPNIAAPLMQSRISNARSLNHFVVSKQIAVDVYLRGLTYSTGDAIIGYSIFGEYYAYSNMYADNYSYDTLRSYYRDQWASDLFLRQTLGRRCDQGVRYYNALEVSSDRSLFLSQFRGTYDNVIDSKWQTAVTQMNSSAYVLGQRLAKEAYAEYAQETGYVEGHRASYPAPARAAYTQGFESTYTSNFQSVVTTLSTSAKLKNVEMTLVKPNEGFFIGSPLKIVVQKATNLGQKEAVELFRLQSNVISANPQAVFRLAGSSSLKENQTIELGTVNGNATVQASAVNVSLAGAVASLSIAIDWTAQVQHFTQMNAGSEAMGETTQWILAKLQAEYKTSDKLYEDRNPNNSLLEQLVAIYKTSDAQGKANIASLRDKLVEAMGPLPTGWLKGREKKRYNLTLKIYNSLI